MKMNLPPGCCFSQKPLSPRQTPLPPKSRHLAHLHLSWCFAAAPPQLATNSLPSTSTPLHPCPPHHQMLQALVEYFSRAKAACDASKQRKEEEGSWYCYMAANGHMMGGQYAVGFTLFVGALRGCTGMVCWQFGVMLLQSAFSVFLFFLLKASPPPSPNAHTVHINLACVLPCDVMLSCR